MTREDKKALWHSPLVITYKTPKTIRMHLFWLKQTQNGGLVKNFFYNSEHYTWICL